MTSDKEVNLIKIIRVAETKRAIILTAWESGFINDIENDLNRGKTLTWGQGKKLREIFAKIQ